MSGRVDTGCFSVLMTPRNPFDIDLKGQFQHRSPPPKTGTKTRTRQTITRHSRTPWASRKSPRNPVILAPSVITRSSRTPGVSEFDVRVQHAPSSFRRRVRNAVKGQDRRPGTTPHTVPAGRPRRAEHDTTPAADAGDPGNYAHQWHPPSVALTQKTRRQAHHTHGVNGLMGTIDKPTLTPGIAIDSPSLEARDGYFPGVGSRRSRRSRAGSGLHVPPSSRSAPGI